MQHVERHFVISQFIRRIFLFFFVSVFCSQLLAQSIWYFGSNMGLDFNSPNAKRLYDGQINNSESCSIATDCGGKLLFYSDGISVWNREHVVMKNGDGLAAHKSSTQGCLIIQRPKNPNLFYIFTLGASENEFSNGINVSTVDLSLGEGLGAVITKNQLLHISAVEKMCATYHKNKEDVWLLWHGEDNDTIYSFLIDENGLGAITATAIGPSIGSADGRGQMKISSTGDKLAFVCPGLMNVFVCDFNNSNGQLSNGFLLPSDLFDPAERMLHGLEFSRNGTRLYVTNAHQNYNQYVGDILQFDLSAGNLMDIINSKTVVGNTEPGTDLRTMQIGPDDKIYVARPLSSYLGIIEDPDMSGEACNYRANGKKFPHRDVGWGLPNVVSGERDQVRIFIPSAFSPNGDQVNDVLFVRSNEFVLNSFIVYDRGGIQVYNSSDPGQGWDGTIKGKPALSGTYAYAVEGTCLNSGQSTAVSGNVTLLR